MKLHAGGKDKLFITFTLILFGHLLILLLIGCTPKWVNKVSNVTNIIWSSEDPVLEILILEENQGCGFGYLKNDGKIVDIFFRWGNAAFAISFATEYGATYYSPFTGQFASIDGNYESKNNNSEAYLTVYSDTMFSGKFTHQVILLTKKYIDTEIIDAKYRSNVNWNASSAQLSFDIVSNERMRGVGTIHYKKTLIEIAFYWANNSRFSIYSLQNDIQSEYPILSGTYVSGNMEATLTIEEDAVFNHEYDTIHLVAKGLNKT